MRAAVTQMSEYGCGIACFAFVAELSYDDACRFLGAAQAESNRFWIKDFAAALNSFGIPTVAKYIKPPLRPMIYREGTIVLLRRSSLYPAGHYLVRYQNLWMDPWINLPSDKAIANARAGYRKRLPGAPMYALLRR